MIVLQAHQRELLRQALKRHRQGYPESEADYVKNVLCVALNTYKKCIADDDTEELALKPRTLAAILKAAHIEPASVGIDMVLPSSVEHYGGYDPQSLNHLAGTYFLHRRSFQTALKIVRGVVDIAIDPQKRCLKFENYNRYKSDSGFDDENIYGGEIYINEDRSLYSLLAITEGQLRLMMMTGPVRNGSGTAASLARGGIRMRGALLTHGRGKGAWQPTFSAISMESLPERNWKTARDQCRTIDPEDPEFEALNRELLYAEEYAAVVTPMMFARSQVQKAPR